jgi:hypothetical protein
MERHELLHAVVHLHMFMAGCLLSWVLVGVDPVRRRSVTVKVVTLAVVGAAHDTLSKLMYAHDLPNDAGTIFQRHLGAEVMYYGDTAIGLALAVVVMTQWWRATGRTPSTHRPRAGRPSGCFLPTDSPGPAGRTIAITPDAVPTLGTVPRRAGGPSRPESSRASDLH